MEQKLRGQTLSSVSIAEEEILTHILEYFNIPDNSKLFANLTNLLVIFAD